MSGGKGKQINKQTEQQQQAEKTHTTLLNKVWCQKNQKSGKIRAYAHRKLICNICAVIPWSLTLRRKSEEGTSYIRNQFSWHFGLLFFFPVGCWG